MIGLGLVLLTGGGAGAQAPTQPGLRIQIDPAPPVCLYPGQQARSDSNTAVVRIGGRALAFPSHWDPIGHTDRRVTDNRLAFSDRGTRVTIVNDRDPSVGKWIESVWQAPSGRLYGWYHAEAVAPCTADLRVPHIGALVSDDQGLTWRALGAVLRAPPDQIDCHAENGFMAGGYGDFSVVPDRAGAFFYIFFTSYVRDEAAQGIAVARYPVAERGHPRGTVAVWSGGAWRRAGEGVPTPLWRPERGWHHRDADAFWGPSVHYNRDLRSFVMLLNHTQGGAADFRSDGIYAAINPDPAQPQHWRAPRRIIEQGFWYPQVVGLAAGDGDARAGSPARFFMSGYSEWFISFLEHATASPRDWAAAPADAVTLSIRELPGWPNPWARKVRRAGPSATSRQLAAICKFGD